MTVKVWGSSALEFRRTPYPESSITLCCARLDQVLNQCRKPHPAALVMMRYTVSRALCLLKSPLAPSRAVTVLNTRLTSPSSQKTTSPKSTTHSAFHSSSIHHQGPSSPSPNSRPRNPHTDFYRTHGRALFKALTLAFFTYQVCYWVWLVLETEEIKDQKSREIKSLEGEVRLLDEGRRSHLPKG